MAGCKSATTVAYGLLGERFALEDVADLQPAIEPVLLPRASPWAMMLTGFQPFCAYPFTRGYALGYDVDGLSALLRVPFTRGHALGYDVDGLSALLRVPFTRGCALGYVVDGLSALLRVPFTHGYALGYDVDGLSALLRTLSKNLIFCD